MTLVAISDVHVGPGLGPWEWQDERGTAALCKWLRDFPNSLVQKDDAPVERHGVVLLGDIFDTWQVPHDIQPPETACESPLGKQLCDAINEVGSRHEVFYVRGNHDREMNAEYCKRYLPGSVQGKYSLDLADNFDIGVGLLEHGHHLGLFCSDDHRVPNRLPVGYFISRLSATADRLNRGHVPTRSQIASEVWDMIAGHEDLIDAIFDFLVERTSLARDTIIKMPANIWGGRDVTIDEVCSIYRGLVGSWMEAKNEDKSYHYVVSVPAAILAELGKPQLAIEEEIRAAKDPSCMQFYVMGHTHLPCQAKYGDTLYLNSGNWSNNRRPYSFVEIDQYGWSGARLCFYDPGK